MTELLSPVQTCILKWGKEGHGVDFSVALTWIALREYYNVKGTEEDVSRWDAVIEKGWQDHLAGNDATLKGIAQELGSEQKTFLSEVGAVVNKAQMPGLNVASCEADWGQWACFCNWAAQQPPGRSRRSPTSSLPTLRSRTSATARSQATPPTPAIGRSPARAT